MKITKITPCGNLGTSPAIVNRKTGEIFIDKEKFAKMTPEQRTFVIMHEAGHAKLNTRNELAADNYAADYLMPKNYSLRGLLSAQTKILNDKNPAHRVRANNLYKRLASYDMNVNNNNKIMNTGSTKYPAIGNRLAVGDLSQNMIQEASRTLQFAGMSSEEMSGFALFKNWKEKRKLKNEKRKAKNEIKLARASKIRNKGDSKLINANKGEGGFLSKVGNIAKGFLNKNQAPEDTGTSLPPTEAPKDNKKTYIIIAIVAVVLIVAIVLIVKKGKK